MKRAYGMDRVMARLKGTTETVIALAVLGFNLKKLAALLYALIRQFAARRRNVLQNHGCRRLLRFSAAVSR